MATLLADRNTIIAPDHAGFGHSDKPAATYDRGFHLDNVDAVVGDAAAGRRVILVGHSLGGIMAALWAARRPERVAALALVATPYPADEMPPADQRMRDHDRGAVMPRVYRAMQVLWPLLTRPVVSRTFPRAVVADYMLHTLASYWGTAQAFLWDPAAGEGLQALRTLGEVPVLLLTASDDRRVPAVDADRWAALLPQSHRVVIAGGHQLLLRDHFAELAAWLRCIDEVSGRQP